MVIPDPFRNEHAERLREFHPEIMKTAVQHGFSRDLLQPFLFFQKNSRAEIGTVRGMESQSGPEAQIRHQFTEMAARMMSVPVMLSKITDQHKIFCRKAVFFK